MSMKILYAVQATGNGHISRAMELIPFLKQYGDIDVFLSGSNSNLKANLPIKYRSNGLSLFYGNTGALDYWRMWKELNVRRIWNEAKALPVEKYDLVINDFDSITSLACKLKKVNSIGFGHQASFQSEYTPRNHKKDFAGEMVLKHYASSTAYIGLHFASYDSYIYPPVIKTDILQADPKNQQYVTVYLSHYSDEVVINALQKIKNLRFEVFSKKVTSKTTIGNTTLFPISNEDFTQSMIHSTGVITGAGFETPAEALYLGKQLLCLPIRGQYEQLCNAAALKDFGVTIIDKIGDDFTEQVYQWLRVSAAKRLSLTHSTYEIVQHAIESGRSLQPAKKEESLLNEEDLLALF